MPRLLPVLLCLMAWLSVTTMARAAYNEWHFTGSDARIVVDRDGRARIDHRLAVRVVAGSIRSLSLSGYPAEALFDADGKVTTDDGRTFALSVGRDGDTLVQATAQDALKRGDYVFELGYRLDLSHGHSMPDGALERLTFTSPALPEGVDGVRVVFDVPAAPTEPRLVTEGQGGVLSALRRSADRDELELVRPHVPRGDAVNWAVRIDPLALAPKPMAAPTLPNVTESKGVDRATLTAWVIGLAFAGLLALKRKVFASRCRQARAVMSGPPTLLAVVVGGAALGVGAHARLQGNPVLAGVLVAVAILVSVLSVKTPPRAMGPGKWVLLRPSDAFEPPGSWIWPAGTVPDVMDARTPRGRRIVTAILVLACVGVIALTRAGSTLPDLPLLLAVAVVAALATGSRDQLWPGLECNASSLRGVFRRLLENDDIKVAPLARVPSGRTEPDEVRLLVVPRAPIPGLLGIEVATAWERRRGAFVPWASVLVRVQENTPASGKMAANRAAPMLPGRKPEERVFRFEPTWPTDASAAVLASQLATSLVDRRVQGACIYSGSERREAHSAERISPDA